MKPLIPCPYCGSQDIGLSGRQMTCLSCGAEGPPAIPNTSGRLIYDQAMDLWNTRQSESWLDKVASRPPQPDPLFTFIDWSALEQQKQSLVNFIKGEPCIIDDFDGIVTTLGLLQKRAEELGLTKDSQGDKHS